MKTLQRAIQRGLGWRRDETRAAARDLARDLALPPEIVSEVLDQAAADLRNIGNADGCLIVNKAVNELAKYGLHARPLDEAALNFYLQQVPEPHLTILRHYRAGSTHAAIAERLGMDKGAVLRSLSRTYADLRMKMIGVDEGSREVGG